MSVTFLKAVEPVSAVPGELMIFNYAWIEDADLRQFVQDAQKRMDVHRTVIKNREVAVGRELLAVKAKLAHGLFGQWVTAYFGGSDKMAQRYMSAAKLVIENDTMSALPITALYDLAAKSTPPEAKAKVLEAVASGEKPTAASVKKIIAAAKAVPLAQTVVKGVTVYETAHVFKPVVITSSEADQPKPETKSAAVAYLYRRLDGDLSKLRELVKAEGGDAFTAALLKEEPAHG